MSLFWGVGGWGGYIPNYRFSAALSLSQPGDMQDTKLL